MSITRTFLISAALFAGSSAACDRNSNRSTTPNERTSMASDVGNGTDASGNGSTTADPQATQSPPCNNATITGQAGNPNCENGGTSGTNTNADSTRINGPMGGQPTTPDPEPR